MKEYIKSLTREQLEKLAFSCLDELVFTDEVRWNEEEKYYYWETYGENLIN